eukprot:scaffold5356_cov118-Isochrysis_galbana.AAC.3
MPAPRTRRAGGRPPHGRRLLTESIGPIATHVPLGLVEGGAAASALLWCVASFVFAFVRACFAPGRFPGLQRRGSRTLPYSLSLLLLTSPVHLRLSVFGTVLARLVLAHAYDRASSCACAIRVRPSSYTRASLVWCASRRRLC